MSEQSPFLRDVQQSTIFHYVNGGFEDCSEYIDSLAVEAEAIGIISNKARKFINPTIDRYNNGEITIEDAEQVFRMIKGLNDERKITLSRERHAKIVLRDLVDVVIIDPNQNRA